MASKVAKTIAKQAVQEAAERQPSEQVVLPSLAKAKKEVKKAASVVQPSVVQSSAEEKKAALKVKRAPSQWNQYVSEKSKQDEYKSIKNLKERMIKISAGWKAQKEAVTK